MSKKLKALSLFANIGVSEVYLEEIGIEVVVANEFKKDRAEIYQKLHPETKMICADITSPETKEQVYKYSDEVELIIATPTCKGFSRLNALKQDNDPRNLLICHTMEIFNHIKPKYMLIENVPQMFTQYVNINGESMLIIDYIKSVVPEGYQIRTDCFNARYYGTPQNRNRAIVRIFKNELEWNDPEKQEEITLMTAIGDLPSLEHGEDSGILYHKAKKLNDHHVECLKHTPTGKSALFNEHHYPKLNGTGRKVKGFKSTYARMNWDKPAPTVTCANISVGNQSNVHPGVKKEDGTYSDARVLTLLEILIISGLPLDWEACKYASESKIRSFIGDGFLPKMAKSLLSMIVN